MGGLRVQMQEHPEPVDRQELQGGEMWRTESVLQGEIRIGFFLPL